MPRKLGKTGNHRISRPRKKNIIPKRKNLDIDSAGPSTSKKKLRSSITNDISVSLSHFYRIISFVSVFDAISAKVICRDCKKSVRFDESGGRGFGFKIVLTCCCGKQEIPSSPYLNNGFEINRKIVFVMRLLGVGREGLNSFCGLMDIGLQMSKTAYDKIVQHIYDASKAAFLSSTRQAVEEEKKEILNRGLNDNNLTVSGDGSWKKRGFSSLFGVSTLIAHYTGKVIDCVVKSAFCINCSIKRSQCDDDEFEDWYETHADECSSNHQGSAGKMEVDSIVEMFQESKEKFGVRFENYIGDGDSKTFKAIVDAQPYGPDFQVKKKKT